MAPINKSLALVAKVSVYVLEQGVTIWYRLLITCEHKYCIDATVRILHRDLVAEFVKI